MSKLFSRLRFSAEAAWDRYSISAMRHHDLHCQRFDSL